MATDSPDLVIAKRLLDHVKDQGFQFQRIAGPDGALVGTRDTDEWTDTVYLDGFSRGCYALRERRTHWSYRAARGSSDALPATR
jgi:hypothetical protein